VSRKYFGTDGIRGVANENLSPELAFKLGQAAGRWLRSQGKTMRVCIGRDTRRSGTMLSAALGSGFCSVGADVVDLGVAPTPAVSFVTRTGYYGLGCIVSASHNPAPDNGIKLVGHSGHKLPDEVELELESLLHSPAEDRPTGGNVGWFEKEDGALEKYVESLIGIVPERLDGLKVAVDAANGAAYELAPRVLEALGAFVVSTGVSPNGMNINAEGGATKPQRIQDFTLEQIADIGVAFDGDADRAVFSDEKGRLINGDRTIGIWSTHWQQHGGLTPSTAVGTVMSNGGFESFLQSRGIALERTPVGDKYVSERLRATGARIGGEQSGHIIFPERGPTGDGLVTMLELLRVLKREGRPASSFYDDYEAWPQLLINVSVQRREGWDQGPRVADALAEAQRSLEGRGRIVVRPSGTQPMIRVMIEAESYELRDRVAQDVLAAMQEELGGEVYSRVDLTHALGD
jgi:phosphoglucosamine mutase